MKLKDPEKLILDDFEHRVTERIRQFGSDAGFPQLQDYQMTKQELEDYLFDKQAILDSGGSVRTQLIVAGVLVVLPVVVLSAIPEASYPWGKWTFYICIAIGIVLAVLARIFLRMVIRFRIRRLANAKIDRYINAVLNFKS